MSACADRTPTQHLSPLLSCCFSLCFLTLLFPNVRHIPLTDTCSQRRGGTSGIQRSEAPRLLTACWPSLRRQVRCEMRTAQPELFLSDLHVSFCTLFVSACMYVGHRGPRAPPHVFVHEEAGVAFTAYTHCYERLVSGLFLFVLLDLELEYCTRHA